MALKQYALILRRWLWLVMLAMFLSGATALIGSYLTKPVYQASSMLLVNQAPSDKISDYTSIIASERLARTYAEMLVGRPILKEAIRTLKLGFTPSDLASRVTVTLVRDTQLIRLTVDHEDPVVAASLANILPEILSQQSEILQTDRYTDTKNSLGKEIDSLNAQIRQTDLAIEKWGQPTTIEGKVEVVRLQTEAAQYRRSLTSLLQSYENVRLVEAQTSSNIVIFESAEIPVIPTRPNIPLNTALGVALGLLLSGGMVFLFEYLDDIVRSGSEVQELLATPVLGNIAKISEDIIAKGPIAIVEPRSPITEAYRVLRTNVQFAGVDKPLKTLLVTSGMKGEGKSTVAINLAVVIAQAGSRVLVVDSDLRRPSLHKQLGRPNRNGLTDMMLQNQSNWSGAVQETSIRNLFLVTAGSLPPNPAEILSSQKLHHLLEHFQQSYDFVILDTPPILAVTDALVLAPIADGILFVVDSQLTRVGTVLNVRNQLQNVGIKLLGVVMNKLVAERGSGYNYYYYHYYEVDPPRSPKPRLWSWLRGPRSKEPVKPEQPPAAK